MTGVSVNGERGRGRAVHTRDSELDALPLSPEADEERRARLYAQLAVSPTASLFSVRRSGATVTSRITIAPYAGTLLAWAPRGDGLAERIRQSPAVQLAPCDERGDLRAEPITAHARLMPADELPTLEAAVKAHGWRHSLMWEAARCGRLLFFAGRPALGIEIVVL